MKRQEVDIGRRRSLKWTLAAVPAVALPPIAYGLNATQPNLQPPTRPLDRAYFGMHMHRADSGTPWPETAHVAARAVWTKGLWWRAWPTPWQGLQAVKR